MGECILIGVLVIIGFRWVSYCRHENEGGTAKSWAMEQARQLWADGDDEPGDGYDPDGDW
jgi:hypothetical protein